MESLFQRWKESDIEYKESFITDGIMNKNQYALLNKKILFITKETNDRSDDDNEKYSYDLRDAIKEKFEQGSKTFIRHLIQWTYVIVNNFSVQNNLTKELQREYLHKFAILNVKKSSGGSRSNCNSLITYIEKNKEFILEQIQIINPTIIITGFRSFLMCKKLFEHITYDQNTLLWQNRKIIRFFHPSYRRYPDDFFINKLKEYYYT